MRTTAAARSSLPMRHVSTPPLTATGVAVRGTPRTLTHNRMHVVVAHGCSIHHHHHLSGDDDLGFIRDVTKHAMAATCVDRAKVYLTGMSQGGMMASWLSARLGDIFAGFVPVSGTNPRGFFEYDSGLASSSSSLAVMPWRLWIHGRNDTTVPADGSPSAASDGTRWWYEPVVTEAATVAVRYSCNSTPTRNTTIEGLAGGLTPAEANLVCMEFGGCANGLRVAFVPSTRPFSSGRRFLRLLLLLLFLFFFSPPPLLLPPLLLVLLPPLHPYADAPPVSLCPLTIR